MSEAREDALVALYEAEAAGLERPNSAVLPSKARRLVEGVSEHKADIDASLEALSHNWKLSRMPAVDRALLRLGAFELGHTETPVGVVISELVELAKRYSTDRSGPFVNGVLAALAKTAGR